MLTYPVHQAADILFCQATDGGDVRALVYVDDTVHNSFAQDLSEADRWLIVESQ